MSVFNRLLNDLFPNRKEGKNPLKEVLVREMIKRNKVFLNDYHVWLEEDMHLGLLEHLQRSRLARDENPDDPINYFRHHQSMSNGFYFRAQEPWNTKEYSFLVQYFIERIESLQYHLHNSTREAVEEEGKLKTVEEFYLKPKLKFKMELPYEQLFGNIIIEHRMQDEETSLVKLMANVYSDRNFKKPYHFEDLLNHLFLV